jgi:uroporphyrinogen-III decarboxylase
VLIQDCTYNDVFGLCRSLVEKYRNERFILSAGCEITVLTPQENLKAMSEARY